MLIIIMSIRLTITPKYTYELFLQTAIHLSVRHSSQMQLLQSNFRKLRFTIVMANIKACEPFLL